MLWQIWSSIEGIIEYVLLYIYQNMIDNINWSIFTLINIILCFKVFTFVEMFVWKSLYLLWIETNLLFEEITLNVKVTGNILFLIYVKFAILTNSLFI